MSVAKLRYLSLQDVASVGLSLHDCIALVEKSLTEHANHEIANPPKPAIHAVPRSFIHAMPAMLSRLEIAGMKWVSGYTDNVQAHLPTITGLIILNDFKTGIPKAVMDGNYITALRTAAATAVGAKHLANRDSAVLGVVGAGVQGTFNALALSLVCPNITTIKAYDTFKPSFENFSRTIKEKLPKVTIVECGSSEECIRGSDVIVTATGELKELEYQLDWVKEGATIFPVHTTGWQHDILFRADMFVVDDWEQFRTSKAKIPKSIALPEKPDAELGEIVIGAKQGRTSTTARIINYNYGLGIHDVVTATEVLRLATEKNIGTELDLQPIGTPLPTPPL